MSNELEKAFAIIGALPLTPKSTRAPTSNIAPFGLRMQPDLRFKLEGAAAAAGRSLNAEIVSRLERSFDGNALITQESLDRHSALMEALLNKLSN